MRYLQQAISPTQSPSQSSAQTPVGGSFPTTSYATINVKSSILYVVLGIGVLILGLLLSCLLICFWVKPAQRRRADLEVQQQQRITGLQEVKVEEDVFRPQVRPFPVLILHPGSNDIFFGLSDEAQLAKSDDNKSTSSWSTMSMLSTAPSLSQGMRRCPSQSSMSSWGFSPRESAESDVLRGEGSPGIPSPALTSLQEQVQTGPTDVDATGLPATISGNLATDDAIVHYNPATHFLTDRHPRLFTAEVIYKDQD